MSNNNNDDFQNVSEFINQRNEPVCFSFQGKDFKLCAQEKQRFENVTTDDEIVIKDGPSYSMNDAQVAVDIFDNVVFTVDGKIHSKDPIEEEHMRVLQLMSESPEFASCGK